jgi:hypothetical protein
MKLKRTVILYKDREIRERERETLERRILQWMLEMSI